MGRDCGEVGLEYLSESAAEGGAQGRLWGTKWRRATATGRGPQSVLRHPMGAPGMESHGEGPRLQRCRETEMG